MKYDTFYPHRVCICYARFPEQAETFSVSSIKANVYSEIGTGFFWKG
jgi:hypothetical protein